MCGKSSVRVPLTFSLRSSPEFRREVDSSLVLVEIKRAKKNMFRPFRPDMIALCTCRPSTWTKKQFAQQPKPFRNLRASRHEAWSLSSSARDPQVLSMLLGGVQTGNTLSD